MGPNQPILSYSVYSPTKQLILFYVVSSNQLEMYILQPQMLKHKLDKFGNFFRYATGRNWTPNASSSSLFFLYLSPATIVNKLSFPFFFPKKLTKTLFFFSKKKLTKIYYFRFHQDSYFFSAELKKSWICEFGEMMKLSFFFSI
jgi:hypothetical protein